MDDVKAAVAEGGAAVKPKKKPILQLVREVRGLEGMGIKDSDPSAALAELLARYANRIVSVAKKARFMGSSEDIEELKRRGLEGLMDAVFMQKGDVTHRWYKYASTHIKWSIFDPAELRLKDISLEGSGDDEEEGCSLSDFLPSNEQAPLDIVEENEDFERLWRLVRCLSRPYRIVLTLRYKDGLTQEEAGRRMGGIKKQRVQQLEAKAIANLKKLAKGLAA